MGPYTKPVGVQLRPVYTEHGASLTKGLNSKSQIVILVSRDVWNSTSLSQ